MEVYQIILLSSDKKYEMELKQIILSFADTYNYENKGENILFKIYFSNFEKMTEFRNEVKTKLPSLLSENDIKSTDTKGPNFNIYKSYIE